LNIESHKYKIRLAKLAASAGIYASLALFLYLPHLKKFVSLQYLVIINTYLAALGCFILSRRWIGSFIGSFFAGVVYGFGPFSLWLSGYHPTVGLLIAAITWLLCPTALCTKRKRPWLSAPLAALPFLTILLAFQATAHYHLFPIPIHTRLHVNDLIGLLAPLVALERSIPLVGFYHVSIAALLLGFSMLLKARRFGILLILAAGLTLSFFGPFFNISPIIWLTIPILCCSVIIGAGLQGIALAGFADRKWLLITSAIMAALAIAALLLSTKYSDSFAGFGTKYARLFTQTARLYLLGAIATGIIFFMARMKLRLATLRWLILSLAMATDILFCASFIAYRVL
jgi:hypothetical protein